MGKNVVTDEHLAEAKRLKALFNAAKSTGLNLTQEKLGIALGGSGQSTAGNYLNGITALNVKSALIFARELKVDVADFSPRIAKLISVNSGGNDSGENNPLRKELIELIDGYSPEEQQKLLDLAKLAFGR